MEDEQELEREASEPTDAALEHCAKLVAEMFAMWGGSPVISFSTDGLVATLAHAYDDGFAAARAYEKAVTDE